MSEKRAGSLSVRSDVLGKQDAADETPTQRRPPPATVVELIVDVGQRPADWTKGPLAFSEETPSVTASLDFAALKKLRTDSVGSRTVNICEDELTVVIKDAEV